ncbi:MAG: hypothetical protein DRQ56_02310, partial [Gammaproteobacteria bacterium]
TVIAMAEAMKIGVVAEGVETQQVLDSLKRKGCRQFQGYFFSRPMPFAKLINLLESRQGANILGFKEPGCIELASKCKENSV